jgi:hypothetical protein
MLISSWSQNTCQSSKYLVISNIGFYSHTSLFQEVKYFPAALEGLPSGPIGSKWCKSSSPSYKQGVCEAGGDVTPWNKHERLFAGSLCPSKMVSFPLVQASVIPLAPCCLGCLRFSAGCCAGFLSRSLDPLTLPACSGLPRPTFLESFKGSLAFWLQLG